MIKEARIGELQSFQSSKDFVRTVSARVFGLLAETAAPILEHYHSDLYHDAILLSDTVERWNIKDSLTWIWSVNSTGTRWQGDNEDIKLSRTHAFRCSLVVTDEVVHFTMKEVDTNEK